MASKFSKSNNKIKNSFGYSGDFSSEYSDDMIDMDEAAERYYGASTVKIAKKKRFS